MARSREELLKIIGSNVDEGALSDQELQDRMAAYQEFGTLPKTGLDLEKLRESLYQAYEQAGYGRNQPLPKKAVDTLVDYVARTGQLPAPGQVAASNVPGDINQNEAIVNPFRERLYSGEFTPGNEVSAEDTKRLQNLIDLRKFNTEQQSALDQFQINTPKALAAEREKFFAAQGARAKDFVASEYAPQVVEQLGARGLADSGEVPDLIARKYGEIQSTIEQEQAAQEADDLKFFSDMAFKTTYQNLINSRTDIRGQLNFQDTALRQEQDQKFTSAQSDIQNKFNLDLFQQEQERALRTYQNQVNKVKQNQSDQFTANLVGQGVQTAGNVALISALG